MNTETTTPRQSFDLKHAVTARGGQVYTSLSARDPKVRDLKKFVKNVANDEVGAVQVMLSDLCEVPVDVIGEVHLHDYNVMSQWLTGLLDGETADA